MIERYTRQEMGELWTDKAKYDAWLAVELAVCRAWGRHGQIPGQSLKIIEAKASYDLRRIPEIEAEVKHDVIAFLTAVAEKVGPDARFIHLGMTSSDLVDTAFSLQLTKASAIIDCDLEQLLIALKKKAHAHEKTLMIGRTHGIHAEPVTFGLKCALWYDEFLRHRRRLAQAKSEIAVGKISGAVGTYVHVSPELEAAVCQELKLTPVAAATQVISRDRHAHFFSALAGIAASIEKIAIELRHLQRTEVFEVAEAFGRGQKGSSAMPHKRNPILSENVTGLARLVRNYAAAALENVALWHERDISHSSVERVIAPDATILVDFMLARMTDCLAQLDVFPERMAANLESSKGLYASQTILLLLAKKGMSREAAYTIVQRCAMESWNEGKHFYDLIAAVPEVQKNISSEELDRAFDVTEYTKHVNIIFQRVFGEE